MSLEVDIHSSEEENNIHVHVEIPEHIFEAAKGIVASVNAGKNLVQEIRQLFKGKDNV